MNPDDVRSAVRAVLEAAWDPDLPLVEWRRRLAAAGLIVPSWPARWGGRDLPGWADDVVADELASAGVPGAPIGSGMLLAAPTILAHGSDALRVELLLATATGALTWCQLFSEPGAGSDLAAVTTRAELDGDDWVVHGQKLWTTSAHHADLGMLLARTDWDVPKHAGLSYLVLPMRQPGVEVRPLHQMNGHASFNEVFLDGARVRRDAVVGGVGEGWRVALTTLAFERRFGMFGRPSDGRGGGRAVAEAQAEADRHFATYSWYPQRAGRPDLVATRAQAAGRSGDPVLRQDVAALVARERAARWTARRARAARALGRAPGPEGSIGKLASSHVARSGASVHARIAGAAGMLTGADDPTGGVVAEVLVSVPAQSIAGGTDEVQRNILGERALGLPREPAADRDVPFREVRRGQGC